MSASWSAWKCPPLPARCCGLFWLPRKDFSKSPIPVCVLWLSDKVGAIIHLQAPVWAIAPATVGTLHPEKGFVVICSLKGDSKNQWYSLFTEESGRNGLLLYRGIWREYMARDKSAQERNGDLCSLSEKVWILRLTQPVTLGKWPWPYLHRDNQENESELTFANWIS